MNTPKLTRLAQTLASAGLLTAGAAVAQSADPAPAVPAARSTGITEVVVTAQKVAQPAIRRRSPCRSSAATT